MSQTLDIANWPRWGLMWSLAVLLYAALKLVSWWPFRRMRAPAWRHGAYLLAWPGMDAPLFLDEARRLPPPRPTEWVFAAAKCVCGAGLAMLVAPLIPPDWPVVAGWTGILAVGFLVHFGVFHLLSCTWRRLGIAAAPIMDWPICATSVAEFWGRRWNLAFRDLTHSYVFRPLARRWGPTAALGAGFLMSGLIHDAVVSLPAGGGYGGPTFFFLVQLLGVLAERAGWARRRGLNRSVRGWVWTACVVVLPLPCLFHRPFVLQVMVPFMEACGVVRCR